MGLGISIQLDGAPDETVGAAVTVDVTESVCQPTYYRLEYGIDLAEGDFPLLKEGKFGPGSEISVLVPTADSTVCLVKGPVYGQQIQFEQGGLGTLVVLGADSLIKMDREDKSVIWSDLTDSAAVSSIFSQAGFTADVETTDAGHFELKHTLIQRETDLSFVRRLARRNGALFWLSADELGLETAHFKRPVLEGDAECDLVINLSDPKTNVTSLEISWDVERPTGADATELDLNSKSDITGAVESSPLTPLGGNGFAAIAGGPRIAHVRAPVDDNGDLQARSESAVIEASFFVHASGSTTLSALGKVIRAHTLVNVRGVGTRHSGLWFCSSVRHTINSDEHRMDFELIRNGWAE